MTSVIRVMTGNIHVKATNINFIIFECHVCYELGHRRSIMVIGNVNGKIIPCTGHHIQERETHSEGQREMVNTVLMATHTTHSWMVPPVVASHWVHDSCLGSSRPLVIVALSRRFHARNTHELATWYDPRPYRCTLASHTHHTRPPSIRSRPTTSR